MKRCVTTYATFLSSFPVNVFHENVTVKGFIESVQEYIERTTGMNGRTTILERIKTPFHDCPEVKTGRRYGSERVNLEKIDKR
jgi:hypothetical protein